MYPQVKLDHPLCQLEKSQINVLTTLVVNICKCKIQLTVIEDKAAFKDLNMGSRAHGMKSNTIHQSSFVF